MTKYEQLDGLSQLVDDGSVPITRMTQEEKIKEDLLSDFRTKLFAGYGFQSDEVLEIMTLVRKQITTGLSREMEVKYIENSINLLMTDPEYHKHTVNHLSHQIDAYKDVLYHLKSLLKEDK